ncbi:ABC transporter permease [bacterium BMS3Abin03]|nr:ABC transporter permease [bacterium BMS3Abin03]
MFKNYFKIAVRNIVKYKLYSFINIVGLAVGIAICLLIFLFINDELSYDKFYPNSDRIYKVIRETGGGNELEGVTPLPLCEALRTDFPEQEVIQVRSANNVISYKEKTFTEKRFDYVDSNFFKVFSFNLVEGNPNTALKNPNSVVITKEIAKKYFGNEEPMGKTLISENKDPLMVTGVMENVPENSHIQFDFLSPKSGYIRDWMKDWHPSMFATYILLPQNYSVENFSKRLPAFLEKYIGKDEVINNQRLKLQPLKDIYLYSSDIKFNPIDKQGDISEIYIFSTIAFIILILAVINYMNLSTSRYSNRMGEIGIRKVIGARRRQLVKQFLGESVITCLIAVVVSIILVELLLPAFNTLMTKDIQFEIFRNLKLVGGIVLFGVIIGLVSGSYPAMFLSSFNPLNIIKGSTSPGAKGLLSRKILIVAQYTLAVAFITCTIIVSLQLNYIRNKNLGFAKENLVAVSMPYELRDKFDAYKNDLLKNKNIVCISRAATIPPNPLGTINPVDFVINGEKKTLWARVMCVDFDFIETLGLKIKEGRDFSKEYGTDEKEAFIFNVAAIKSVGVGNAIGRKVKYFGEEKKIIGVVKDFNYWTLREKIDPVVIFIKKDYCWRIVAKIRSGNIIQTMSFLKNKWENIFSGWPFEFSFVDNNLDELYKKEVKLGKLSEYLTVLAVFIACLGLFGLSSFTAKKRTKEIGIRKVLGASISDIVRLLSKEFLILVCIADIIALPLAYYFINQWLQDFSYKIAPGIWVFILSGIFALLVAVFTVSFQAVKAATTNPVESLRYE